MEKNILIAGKDLPSCSEFADGLSLAGFNVAAAGNPENAKSLTSGEIKIIQWNKASAISARAFIIQAETLNGTTDDAILFFDAPFFSSAYHTLSTDTCSPACDSMILGFQNLTLELINRAEQHKSKNRIIFILKTMPSRSDVSRSPSLKKTVTEPANAIVAAAEASFATFAENIAAHLQESANISALLVTGDTQNETMQKDSALAAWLKDYIEALDAKKSDSKSLSWIKAGAKLPAAFSIFH